jgi:hypothetical protein
MCCIPSSHGRRRTGRKRCARLGGAGSPAVSNWWGGYPRRGPPAAGCQYTSAAYAALADECEVTLSVGRTGQCWDNALAESFFSSLKGELIDTRAWPTRAGARRAVVEYIGWYNGTRLHSSLGYQSPADYENNQASSVTKPSTLSVKAGQPQGLTAVGQQDGTSGAPRSTIWR